MARLSYKEAKKTVDNLNKKMHDTRIPFSYDIKQDVSGYSVVYTRVDNPKYNGLILGNLIFGTLRECVAYIQGIIDYLSISTYR